MASHLVKANSEKLIELRLRIGWTQVDAARRSGYSDRLIRKIEKGLPVRQKTLQDIVRSYQEHLPASEILDWTVYRIDESETACKQDHFNEMMNEARERTRRYYKLVYEDRKLELIKTFIAPAIRFTSDGTTRIGIESVEQRTRALLAGFKPIKIKFEQLYCEHDTIIVNFVATMRHTGDFQGISPTHRDVSVRNLSILRFENALCVEAFDQTDVSHLFSQLS